MPQYNDVKSQEAEKWRKLTDISSLNQTTYAITFHGASGLWTRKWTPATAATIITIMTAAAAALKITNDGK